MMQRYELIAQAKKQRQIPDLIYAKRWVVNKHVHELVCLLSRLHFLWITKSITEWIKMLSAIFTISLLPTCTSCTSRAPGSGTKRKSVWCVCLISWSCGVSKQCFSIHFNSSQGGQHVFPYYFWYLF